MAWGTAITDIRAILSDGATDKLASRKKVFGLIDGTNTVFKTFEIRRLTDLTTATAPFGVFVNSAFTGVVSDSVESGHFNLGYAPKINDRIEATYYHQWFNDTQLEVFLRMGSNYIGYGDDYTTVDGGLRPCVLKYACADAYQELAVRYSRMLSEQYRVEDLPKEAIHEVVKGYDDLSKSFRDAADKLLKNFYTRQGRANAPLFAFGKGHVRDVAPNR